jgi:hypothetical protein
MSREEITARFEVLEHGKNLPSSGQQGEKAAKTVEMVWIRSCPHCSNKMCKYTLQYSITCEGCGWVWL